MDSLLVSWFPAIVCSVLVYYLFILLLWTRKKTRLPLPLPPGPSGWPIVGNLFQLGEKLHESLFVLSRQYGPLMSLSLGIKTTVVVSSPAMAREFLKVQDHIFVGRTVLEAAKILSHHKSSIAWGQNGPYWRNVRRIFSAELMSPKRLQDLQHLRRDQVFQTLRSIFEDSNVKGRSVNIEHVVVCTVLNLLGKMIFSTSLFDPNNLDSVEFKEALARVARLTKPNLVDFLPFLSFLDPQGLRREMTPCLKRVYNFIDVFIKNRLAVRSKNLEHSEKHKDFLGVLLDFSDDGLTLTDIRALLYEFLIAGSDTTSTTIEWAMAELIHNPYQMKRVQQELDEVIGRDRRVEEADLERLPYLRAVVKEVFRLHPAIPLMIPHRPYTSSDVAGFLIPKDSMVIVNVWAIGRDPATWKEPSEFMPQRFMEGETSKVDYKGHDFELLPFGSGRRMCVGLPLASKMVHLVLASLLHSFEWTLPQGMKGEEMDMSETFGVGLKKAVELHAVPTPRLAHHMY